MLVLMLSFHVLRTNRLHKLHLVTFSVKLVHFAKERDWDRFHVPRNLVLALTGEVGELAELFQWKEDCPPGLPNWTDREKEHLGEELSDVLLYLVRLADRCGIDLPTAAIRKMSLNAKKYPAPDSGDTSGITLSLDEIDLDAKRSLKSA